jgi:hypothetical protein
MVTENVSNNAEACREKPKKWDETYKVDFVNNIDVDSIQNLKIQLENLNIENVVQSDIDTLVGKLGEIFVSSAMETFGIASKPFKNKKRKVCISSKPWFGADCKFARQHYRKLKRRSKTNNTEETRELMKKAEKYYKKQMYVSIKKHRKEMTKKIKNLRSNNSKEFWKLMRKGTYRKQPNISIDTLFDFFKTLNQNPTNDGDGATVLCFFILTSICFL